ncbi:hypothetical protein NL676_011814 [Syzygium grande]|nr:hypothetical protein NL676_011814 [Syzygium grande]
MLGFAWHVSEEQGVTELAKQGPSDWSLAAEFVARCGFVGTGATTKARLFNWGHHGSAAKNSNFVTGTGSSTTLECRQGSSTESWSWRYSVVVVKTHAQERG